jgi:YidC/Oxa1 family membrane protein insertase
MEKRVLIAIVLCFATLYLWNTLVVKPVVKPAAPPGQASQAGGNKDAAPVTPPAAAPAPPAGEVEPTPIGSPAIGEAEEREVRVETNDVVATFTNRGARLKSWRLKRYFDQQRSPQELVVAVDKQPLPFALQVADTATTVALNSGLYTVSGAPTAPLTSESARLRFEYATQDGLHAVKEFGLAASGYVVEFTGSVERKTDDRTTALPYTIHWGPAVGDVGQNVNSIKQAEGILFQDGKVRRLSRKDFASQPVFEGTFGYAGVDDNYFMTAALFPGAAKVTYTAVTVPPPADSKEPARDLVSYAVESAASGARRFFAGPKDFDVLAAVDRDVVRAIDFGMFAVLVVPLLRSLKWVNGFVGNYGWSIVILTIIINAIMFPLRHKSVVSMRKMQEVQPEVKAIQDRYSKLKATDPAKQKMNTEMMALYRERGINPAGGCVPMLLTMPVLIAFYALLSGAIELRGAPFFGWIHDLSVHDPLYITPVLTGATMLWQQRLMPAAAGTDPTQQKMIDVRALRSS